MERLLDKRFLSLAIAKVQSICETAKQKEKKCLIVGRMEQNGTKCSFAFSVKQRLSYGVKKIHMTNYDYYDLPCFYAVDIQKEGVSKCWHILFSFMLF